jgi:hypothetical protein
MNISTTNQMWSGIRSAHSSPPSTAASTQPLTLLVVRTAAPALAALQDPSSCTPPPYTGGCNALRMAASRSRWWCSSSSGVCCECTRACGWRCVGVGVRTSFDAAFGDHEVVNTLLRGCVCRCCLARRCASSTFFVGDTFCLGQVGGEHPMYEGVSVHTIQIEGGKRRQGGGR